MSWRSNAKPPKVRNAAVEAELARLRRELEALRDELGAWRDNLRNHAVTGDLYPCDRVADRLDEMLRGGES